MNRELIITKKMADAIVQVCFDVGEFSRLYEQEHLNSAKHLFQCNEEVKKGVNWFTNAQNQSEFQIKVSEYLNAVNLTKQLYQNIHIPIENKDKIIIQLSNIQEHLSNLQNETINNKNK